MQSSGKAEKLLKRIGHKRVLPPALTNQVSVPDLIDNDSDTEDSTLTQSLTSDV